MKQHVAIQLGLDLRCGITVLILRGIGDVMLVGQLLGGCPMMCCWFLNGRLPPSYCEAALMTFCWMIVTWLGSGQQKKDDEGGFLNGRGMKVQTIDLLNMAKHKKQDEAHEPECRHVC